jgi:FtsZ-interacting cell division protein ZipA
MDPWSIGLIVVIVAGLAAIVFGALWDRQRNKRRAAEMLAPPKRTIPRFKPDAPAPHYLSDLQARRRPENAGPTDLSEAERQTISRQLADPNTVTVDAGYASRDFITDSRSGWAILERPAVLVCGDAIETFRELLGTLES